MTERARAGEDVERNGWMGPLILAIGQRNTPMSQTQASVVIDALRSLPVEQRMEAMGMRPRGWYCPLKGDVTHTQSRCCQPAYHHPRIPIWSEAAQ